MREHRLPTSAVCRSVTDGLDISVQCRRGLAHLQIELLECALLDVQESSGHMQAIADCREGTPRSVEELQAFARVFSRTTFNDVRGDGECCPPCLRSQLETFVGRKRRQRQLMKSDEEIVRALPRDK